jgi:hypothetical protein
VRSPHSAVAPVGCDHWLGREGNFYHIGCGPLCLLLAGLQPSLLLLMVLEILRMERNQPDRGRGWGIKKQPENTRCSGFRFIFSINYSSPRWAMMGTSDAEPLCHDLVYRCRFEVEGMVENLRSSGGKAQDRDRIRGPRRGRGDRHVVGRRDGGRMD